MAHPYYTTPYYEQYQGNLYPAQDHLHHQHQPQQPMRPTSGFLPNTQYPLPYLQAPPHLNTQRFESNAHIPSPVTYPQFQPSFNAGVFRHLPVSNPPPPPPYHPLPPYSPHNNGISSHQSFPPLATAPAIAQNSETQGGRNLEMVSTPTTDGKGISGAPSQLATVNAMVVQDKNSIEEGELSDGEIDGSAEMSTNQSPRQSPLDRILHNGLDGTSERLQSRDAGTASMQRVERLPSEIPTNSASDGDVDGSMSSYNPPSAPTPNGEGVEGGFPDVPGVTEPGVKTPAQGDFSVNHMKELAKDALRALAPFSITYAQMLQEGIDAHTLRELYAELGLQDMKARPAVLAKPQPKQGLQMQRPVHGNIDAQKGIVHQSSRVPQLSGSDPPIPVPALADTAEQHHEATETKAGPVPEPHLNKPVPSVSVPSPVLERKDRIAQLLAAKAGRAPSSRVTPETPSPQLPAKPGPTKIVTAVPIPFEAVQTIDSIPDTTRSQREPEAANIGDNLPSVSAESLCEPIAPKWLAQLSQPQEGPKAAPQPQVRTSRTSLNGTSLKENRHGVPLNQSGETVSQPRARAVEAPAPARSHFFEIPGLFLTPEESFNEEPDDMTDADDGSDGSPTELTVPADNDESLMSDHELRRNLKLQVNTNIQDQTRQQTKRPLDGDEVSDSLPPAKRLSTYRSTSHSTTTSQVTRDEMVSEGEVMEVDTTPGDESGGESKLYAINLPQPIATVKTTHDVLPSVQGTWQATISPTSHLMGQTTGAGWQTKAWEIEAMKRKIAEMEERRKLKPNTSQVVSPVTSTPEKPERPQIVPPPTSPPSLKTSNLPGTNVEANTADGFKEIAYKAAGKISAHQDFSMKEAQLKEQILRQRLLRQRALREGLPGLKDQLLKTQDKLATKQAEMERIRGDADRQQTESQTAREREDKVKQEVLLLEEQLHEGFSGQQQYTEELRSLKTDPEISQACNPQEQEPTVSSMAPAQDEIIAIDDENANTNVDQDEAQFAAEDTPLSQAEETFLTAQQIRSDVQYAIRDDAQARQDVDDQDGSFEGELGSEAMQQSGGSTRSSRQSIDVDTDEAQDDLSALTLKVDNDLTESDLDNEGSASMHDSQSEDAYQPAGASPERHQELFDDVLSDDYNPENALTAQESPTIHSNDFRGDDHEPETSPHVDDAVPLPPNGYPQPGSPTIHVVTSLHDTSDERLQTTEPTLSSSTPKPVLSFGNVPPNDAGIETKESASRFRPYQSPLSTLKSFRFNPKYNDLVKEGYRSLTYSYNIDPSRPLCPNEVEGGACADPDCEEQHFRQMTLSDAKILEDLASSRDIEDKVQRDVFMAGLKQVIASLRTRSVKEFSEVASELAAYRRQFMEQQDPALVVSED